MKVLTEKQWRLLSMMKSEPKPMLYFKYSDKKRDYRNTILKLCDYKLIERVKVRNHDDKTNRSIYSVNRKIVTCYKLTKKGVKVKYTCAKTLNIS